MRHVIIASHHRFAEGLLDTLEFIGGVEGVTAISAYVDETPLEDQVAEAFATFDPQDEVLVLTDIMQGSVNQAFAPYMGEHVFLVAGVNVALSLELTLDPTPLTAERIEEAVLMAAQSMRLMNTYVVEDDDEDE